MQAVGIICEYNPLHAGHAPSGELPLNSPGRGSSSGYQSPFFSTKEIYELWGIVLITLEDVVGEVLILRFPPSVFTRPTFPIALRGKAEQKTAVLNAVVIRVFLSLFMKINFLSLIIASSPINNNIFSNKNKPSKFSIKSIKEKNQAKIQLKLIIKGLILCILKKVQ